MSIRFERFIKRVGKKSEFLPFRNRLLDTMNEDAKAKYKNYPKLIENMNRQWENGNYKREKDIAHLLSDNVDPFMMHYLKIIFPFRNRGLIYKDVSTPSRLDFIITVIYHYSEEEIKIIDDELKGGVFPKDPTVEKICKFILLYAVNSFAEPIEEVFKGPFAFIPQKITADEQKDGSFIISVSVQGREQ